MANVMCFMEGFNSGAVEDKFSSSSQGFESLEYGTEACKRSRDIYSLGSDYGFHPDESSLDNGFIVTKYDQEQQQQLSCSDFRLLDGVSFNVASPPIQTYFEEMVKLAGGIQDVIEPKKEKHVQFSFPALELLNNYRSGFKRLNGEGRIIEPRNDTANTEGATKKFSTEEIFRFAGEIFIQSSSQIVDGLSMVSHPFNLSFSGLSNEEIKDVELAGFLLASAEKVGCQEYDRAKRFLNQCDSLSSDTGTPVQRIVYYFSEALKEKIDRETGRFKSKGLERVQKVDIDEAIMSPNPATLACHQTMPFAQITQFAGIQAIIDNMAEASRVHIIDLGIMSGIQWAILMQALASRQEGPIELLKITAIGTTSKHLIEDTGRRLRSFAESMNLPFSFKIVMVSDILDLKENLFETDATEMVAVFSQFLLRSMIVVPDRLEALMRIIRKISPYIMVVIEVEANLNSPFFVSRFIEALFFYSAYFDCLEACMKRDNVNRVVTESRYFGEGIRNILAAEGNERKIRNVNIDVWRAFFARFGMLEADLSMSSHYQAKLLTEKFNCGSSCTLDMNGKCLIVGWKGTPLLSVSAWKFY